MQRSLMGWRLAGDVLTPPSPPPSHFHYKPVKRLTLPLLLALPVHLDKTQSRMTFPALEVNLEVRGQVGSARSAPGNGPPPLR